jgi:hypothetical protein
MKSLIYGVIEEKKNPGSININPGFSKAGIIKKSNGLPVKGYIYFASPLVSGN